MLKKLWENTFRDSIFIQSTQCNVKVHVKFTLV